MPFFQKIKWILGILMVLVLIIVTNLLDRKNFLRVKESIVTIYDDRLVANDLIFDMSTAIHQKQLAILSSDSLYYQTLNDSTNGKLAALVERYERTRLTDTEREIFDTLKGNLTTLYSLEKEMSTSFGTESSAVLEKLRFTNITLQRLSKIQLAEGKKQMKIGTNAANSVELFTQMELYMLVTLAIIVQLLIMYRPKQEQ